ncbi:MAG: energy transducer TonB [Sphingomonadaceae bacterium]
MYTGKPSPRDRFGASLGAATIIALVGWALLASLQLVHRTGASPSADALITVELPPPAKTVVPERKPSRKPVGEAAPPNLKSNPVEVVAVKVPILQPPPPIVAAPIADLGVDPSAGSAPMPGPGTGAGGIGNGRGSGGNGDGTGGGSKPEEPPRLISGRLRFSDAAQAAGSQGLIGRRMTTEFAVGVNGRVSECKAVLSSGLPAVDARVCELIEKRFRYQPAKDERGLAVKSYVIIDHSWGERP